ncbi:MAG: hypothetical protein K8W52_26545 [Deltaproteobacteria bacterium]|nr:hypothetical protein [Deltaproteobacteria bacterium]
MRRAIIAVILASAAVAQAAPPELPAAPSGWQDDATRTRAFAARLSTSDHFAGAPLVGVATRVAVSDGNTLSIWRLTTAPQPDLPRGVRAELELVHAAAGGAKPELAVWQERVVDRVAEANLAWRRAGDRTDVRTRVLISASATGVTAIGAECAIRDGAAPAARGACEHVLEALVSEVAAADRVDLAIPAVAAVAAPAAAPVAPPAMTEPTAPAERPPPPSMREGDSLPRVAPPPPEPERDRRPFLIAGGALVLAALLLWNRSKRRAIEAAHGPTAPRRRFRARDAEGAEPDGDGDADALADAANTGDAASPAAAAPADRPDAPTIKDPP